MTALALLYLLYHGIRHLLTDDSYLEKFIMTFFFGFILHFFLPLLDKMELNIMYLYQLIAGLAASLYLVLREDKELHEKEFCFQLFFCCTFFYFIYFFFESAALTSFFLLILSLLLFYIFLPRDFFLFLLLFLALGVFAKEGGYNYLTQILLIYILLKTINLKPYLQALGLILIVIFLYGLFILFPEETLPFFKVLIPGLAGASGFFFFCVSTTGKEHLLSFGLYVFSIKLISFIFNFNLDYDWVFISILFFFLFFLLALAWWRLDYSFQGIEVELNNQLLSFKELIGLGILFEIIAYAIDDSSNVPDEVLKGFFSLFFIVFLSYFLKKLLKQIRKGGGRGSR